MPIRPSLFLSAVLCSAAAFAQSAPIKIVADLSEAPRRLYHAEIDIPVKSGPLTLTTPKWIPGNHRPTGPVDDITGVVFTANGETLKWRRDDVDLYEFHLTVPKGVTNVHAHLDFIVEGRVTDHMAVLEWEKLLLYPADKPGREIAIQPSITVPAGWGIGTALQPTGAGTNAVNTGIGAKDHGPTAGATTTNYAATTVEQLEDSPAIAGQYFHEFPLAPEMGVKHYIDVVSDLPEDSNLRPDLLAETANLVREANAAYGSHHYNTYHFLLTLSDVAGGEGLEHGQSSDNGVGEKAFSTAHPGSDLLAHEYTHSWNGKYRRPARLYQEKFSTAEQGDLLWVYEGMTQYMGNVLAVRSGLKTKQQYLDTIATTAAGLDTKAGRQWRSTEDTAIAASILRGGSPAWSNWKRGQDYYQEGALLWLDADTKIRQLTQGKKSLTDFQQIFLAKGGSTGPMIAPYERPELIADLNTIAPYDWATFLRDRVDAITPRADVAGIEQGGYKLVYLDHPPKREAGEGPQRGGGGPDVWYSLGIRIGGGGPAGRGGGGEGTISDVRWGGPGDDAGLYPGQKIVAVNGTAFSAEALIAAVKGAKGTSEPIHFLVEHEGAVKTVDLSYHDGERYPSLERVDGTPDFLGDIAKPLAAPVTAAK
ncbi:M61 family metallopeptidase [Granulicella tundricola]|uniref:Peptidase M61 domain protein n=1 Tax=Granulicella tundricola (strain ATCC BAA-1859 / DSM 23138 / MP5ACTX9) TaxID=1198114 RepID=E8X672_GRATM|nr:PDZ domain-containing protein [Granulicella tundricola]ADW70956.1 peptidase M61 domain protein [Granulicella tundricola MP5ACTX9]